MTEESAWQKFKKKSAEKDRAVKPWDLLDPNVEKVDEAEHSRRYDICLGCPELLQVTKQCKKCGCFMKAKTGLAKATCPLGKW
jgi:hypothetical protein